MTEEDFIAAFKSPLADPTEDHDGIVDRLRERLRQLPSYQQFHVLFPIAVKNPYIGEFPVLDAARLLKDLSPECPIPCDEAIRALLPEWSVSLEEVPFYLAARFSPAHVYEAIARLESEIVAESHRVSLKTVLYWVHVYEGTWPVKS